MAKNDKKIYWYRSSFGFDAYIGFHLDDKIESIAILKKITYGWWEIYYSKPKVHRRDRYKPTLKEAKETVEEYVNFGKDSLKRKKPS